MATDRTAPTFGESVGLDERILGTLHGLGGSITFSGLRRVLDAHPESLSRSLRRLEREGLVERVGGGYRALAGPGGVPLGALGELRTVSHLDLPPGPEHERRLRALAGRWFGTLRWIGEVSHPEGRLLAWARRDGSGLVLLRPGPASVTILVPGTPEAGEFGDAEDAAFELLFHAIESLRPPKEGARSQGNGPVAFDRWTPTIPWHEN
jgi:DNA-binding Lrp family transcriptional regulator